MLTVFIRQDLCNHDIIKTKDRDFWIYFKDLLSDPNASSIFESVFYNYIIIYLI